MPRCSRAAQDNKGVRYPGRGWTVPVVLCLSLLVLVPRATHGQVLASATQPAVRIGIVIDGPWVRNDDIRSAFEREITDLLAGEFVVAFPAELQLTGDWKLATIDSLVQRLPT